MFTFQLVGLPLLCFTMKGIEATVGICLWQVISVVKYFPILSNYLASYLEMKWSAHSTLSVK